LDYLLARLLKRLEQLASKQRSVIVSFMAASASHSRNS
jgi:hypothetical protein